MPGGGDDAIITVAGTYTVTLDVTVAMHSLTLGGSSGTQTLSNAGQTLQMNSASTVNANGVVNMSAGTLTLFNPSLTVSGTVNWSGGTIWYLAITSTGTMNLSGSADKTAAGTWLNAGTVTWTGTGNFTVSSIFPSFENQSGGNFNVQTDATLGGTVFSTFLNDAGATFTKSVTTGTTTVIPDFQNSGTVSLQTGLLSSMGPSGYRQFAGATHLLGGNLSTPALSAVISGGVLDGNGTFTGVELLVTSALPSFGQVNPGTSPGLINVVGMYSQNLSGTYNAEIGGLTPGTQYDQISVTGTVTLAGFLNVSLIGGFTPAVGNQFVILNNGSASPVTFSFAGYPEGTIITVGGVQLRISYIGGDGNDVVLTVVAAPGTPTPTPTSTPTNTPTPTMTPTGTPVTATPTSTPTMTPSTTPAATPTSTPVPGVSAATIPTLGGWALILLGAALALLGLVVLRRL